MDNKDRTLYCGNLSENVTEDLLYELFQQAGPLEGVSIPKDKEGNKRNFGFVTFKHEVSVPYAVALMRGVSLFGKHLRLEFRTGAESGGNPYLEKLISYQISVAHSSGQNYSSPEMRNSNSSVVQYPLGRHRPHNLNGDRFQNDSRLIQNQSLTNSASPQNFHSPNPYGYGNSSPYDNSERSPYSPQPWPSQNQPYGWNNSSYSESRSHHKSNSVPRTRNRY